LAAKVGFEILFPIYLSQIKKELPGVSCLLSRNAPHSWSRGLIDSCQADPPELTQQRWLGQCTLDGRAHGGKAWAGTTPTEQTAWTQDVRPPSILLIF